MHPYSSNDTTAAWKKLCFILSVRSDFHMTTSLSIAVYASNPYFTNIILMYYGQAKAGWPAQTYILQLCEDTGCNPEDLPEVMNNREKWRERVREIRAGGTTWWWWWWWWWLWILSIGVSFPPINVWIALKIPLRCFCNDPQNYFVIFPNVCIVTVKVLDYLLFSGFRFYLSDFWFKIIDLQMLLYLFCICSDFYSFFSLCMLIV